MDWPQIYTLSGVIATVVGVPLSIMIYYLRNLNGNLRQLQDEQRELRNEHRQLSARHVTLENRVQANEGSYTSHAEWVREAAEQRQQIEKLTNHVIELKTASQTEAGVTAQLRQLVTAICENRKDQK